uniref:ribosomal protein S4 n=1 Tax=Phacus arnoldii TaxID=298292 RepID=UPI0023AABE35|nr:ribosomal protein S4 [Phacus arnoldii]WCH63575.1 ribosomal protein S4 [Phacus arnoldii]
MSRYRGPRLRVVRRLGKLPGFTTKITERLNPPGEHGSLSGKKISQYNLRLKEKQKLRFYYGITERQLLNYLKKAKKKKGSSGVELLISLEMRLDNIIFRLGLSRTIIEAKQLITHGHILVDNTLVNIPSFICKPLNIIKIKNTKFKENIVSFSKDILIPPHLSLNLDKLEAKVNSLATRNSLILAINELRVVEYYSRKL